MALFSNKFPEFNKYYATDLFNFTSEKTQTKIYKKKISIQTSHVAAL